MIPEPTERPQLKLSVGKEMEYQAKEEKVLFHILTTQIESCSLCGRSRRGGCLSFLPKAPPKSSHRLTEWSHESVRNAQ